MATPRPSASTARPQSTNAARDGDAGKRTIAAIERKNPAGITSNPAYFMVVPFSFAVPAANLRLADSAPASAWFVAEANRL
jgi:hypothetical protein